MQRQVPQVLRVRHPSDSVHRQCVGHSCYATETGIRSATVQVAGSVHSCFLADAVVAALVVEIGSCMFEAGFAGDHAIRAVLPLIGGRPKICGIMVDMDHKVCVHGARSCIQHLLVRQWIQVRLRRLGSCISVTAWIDSEYNLCQSTELFRIPAQCLV